LVLDASVSFAWCIEQEKTPLSERVLDMLAAGAEAVVPSVWVLEVSNALLAAERRKRITTAQSDGFLQKLTGFAISIDPAEMTRAFDRVQPLARQHNLTAYDAAYLELALRRHLPLATLDTALIKAARALGVPLLGAG
jgi:predicted nucleic acid-binding protein